MKPRTDGLARVDCVTLLPWRAPGMRTTAFTRFAEFSSTQERVVIGRAFERSLDGVQRLLYAAH